VDRLLMALVEELRLVERLATVLLVVLRPVDRLPMLLVAVLRPVDVEVERLTMLLVAVLRPLDSDAVTVFTCSTLTASWSAVPGATPVITRLPTFTSPAAVCLLASPKAS